MMDCTLLLHAVARTDLTCAVEESRFGQAWFEWLYVCVLPCPLSPPSATVPYVP